MQERQFSTGEVAKISGLTIRTLQHYDNIGVLPASGRTEGGRRFYTEDDIAKLEHIVFYQGLGFSLDQIKEKLSNIKAEENAMELLSSQKSYCIIRLARSRTVLPLSKQVRKSSKQEKLHHGHCLPHLCTL
ncbi:hypothetical protein C823_006945 [Eubacterium plexicaudatum ASF492]|nr:hypothetical protein C823_006945 [Eubacterium plexicaudatum ASF492]